MQECIPFITFHYQSLYLSSMSNSTSLDNSTGIEKESFLKEIENMKKVSEADSELGRFVVNMVGCVTIQEPLLLVLECNHYGDLLTYLRENRRKSEVVINEWFIPYIASV